MKMRFAHSCVAKLVTPSACRAAPGTIITPARATTFRRALGSGRNTRMSRRTVGLTFLNLAGVLVILGALYDLLVPSVPPNHLAYVGATNDSLDPRYAALDLTMLRSIGGCLLAIGVTTLV